MDRFPPEKIRNVALIGHGGSGKTTLAEALLHVAGVTSRPGRVEDGTTVCDHDAEEHQRGQSLGLALAPFEWKGHKINLIDTPGYADFVSDVHAALGIADLAVFVVSAVEGIQVQTEVFWRLAARWNIPRMVFVNKLDKDRASFERTLDELRDRFGAGIAPLELPIGSERDFRGIADLLTDTAWIYDKGQARREEIPEDMEAREHEVHDNLVEGIVVGDDRLLEGYLEGDVPSVEELERTLAAGVDDAIVFPVVCGSALAEVAVDRLADFICEIGPSPLDRPPTKVIAGDTEVEVTPDPDGQPLAFVFKTVTDQFVGHISMFKVLSGTIKGDDHLVNSRSRTEERLHGLVTLRGGKQEPTNAVVAGDIAAVPKLSATLTGDTLAPRGSPVVAPAIEQPPAVLSIAIKARTQADDDKLGSALHRIQEEDLALQVERNPDTGQTLLRGTGETHLAITIERLARKFGVHVDTEPVRVPYRETVTSTGEAEGRYKKQSGGHGQFGVCTLRVAPLERGEGFRFVDAVVGGAIPKAFIPAVEKGVRETIATGAAFGHPVVDVEVTCLDGKHHSVDSSEMSFKMAGRLAFREAVAKASPALLEPVSLVEVIVPTAQQGDVLGDLNARRGRVVGTEPADDGEHRITAMVPAAEMTRYAIELRALTGGCGRFSATHDHYDPVPQHLIASVTAGAPE